jgi:hypothetical protein
MVSAMLYLVSPALFGGLLYYELLAGAFPPESDAIAIPFMGFVFLWLIGLIVGAGVLIGLKVLRNKN